MNTKWYEIDDNRDPDSYSSWSFNKLVKSIKCVQYRKNKQSKKEVKKFFFYLAKSYFVLYWTTQLKTNMTEEKLRKSCKNQQYFRVYVSIIEKGVFSFSYYYCYSFLYFTSVFLCFACFFFALFKMQIVVLLLLLLGV